MRKLLCLALLIILFSGCARQVTIPQPVVPPIPELTIVVSVIDSTLEPAQKPVMGQRVLEAEQQMHRANLDATERMYQQGLMAIKESQTSLWKTILEGSLAVVGVVNLYLQIKK